MSNSVQRTRRLTQLALMIALEAVLFATPLGLIIIPPIAMTTMHIPVIIAAMLLGPVSGAILGCAFGLMAMAKATLAAVSPVDMMFSPFLSGNPSASVLMCVVTRILLGLIAAWAYVALSRILRNKVLVIGLAAAIATVCHTLMVLGCLSFFFSALSMRAVFATILTLNGVLETAAAVIVSIGVVLPLQKANLKG